MYTKKIYDVSDYSECGNVAFESWGAHYTNEQERSKALISILTNCAEWELYRISTAGAKTGTRIVTVEKVFIKQPWDSCADEEDAIILTDRGGNKLLIDVNHIPYQEDTKGGKVHIYFSTGLVLREKMVSFYDNY